MAGRAGGPGASAHHDQPRHRTSSNPDQPLTGHALFNDVVVHVTKDELTLVPSVVAAIAIVGGYLGVRSASHNAIRLARQEREARRRGEVTDMKKAAYAHLQSALNQLATASLSTELLAGRDGVPPERLEDEGKERGKALADARVRAEDALGEVQLLTDDAMLVAEAWLMVQVADARVRMTLAKYNEERYGFLQTMNADLRADDPLAAHRDQEEGQEKVEHPALCPP
jgi:hypothetical protein